MNVVSIIAPITALILSAEVSHSVQCQKPDKKQVINDMISGCTQSLLEPSLERFKEIAASKGHPYPDDTSAIKDFKLMQNNVRKTSNYKNIFLPAAVNTCKCVLREKIEIVKNEIEPISCEKLKEKLSTPTDPQDSKECAIRYLLPAFKNK